jgi:ribonuclease HI
MFVVYTDGGSRGNPGKAAYGVVVTENGRIVYEGSEYLGIRTNNYAEYRGLIAGITKVIELKGKEAEFVMDSQLVIRQMTGAYKVRSPDMKPLHDDAAALASLIPSVRFRNVRRSEELIPRADALVNMTLDRNRALDAS